MLTRRGFLGAAIAAAPLAFLRRAPRASAAPTVAEECVTVGPLWTPDGGQKFLTLEGRTPRWLRVEWREGQPEIVGSDDETNWRTIPTCVREERVLPSGVRRLFLSC